MADPREIVYLAQEADEVFRIPALERYEKFLAAHPRLALGIAVSGGCLTILGLAGVPSDLESWAAAFRFIGSDEARWVFVIAGVIVIGSAALAQKYRGTGSESDKPPLSPTDRLQIMDDLFYPPADPRRELGEECRAFAIKVRVTVEWYEARRVLDIARVAAEAVAANPDLDMEQAYEDARSLIERNLRAQYAVELREEGLKLFDQAREQDAILARYRREVEHPSAYALEEVANIFRAIARRLGVDASEPEPIPKAKFLADGLDALIREGMDLRHELEAPVEPEESSPGNWSIVGGVPEGWWEKVDAFDGRIRELLRVECPALLGTYAENHNATARQLREADANREPPDHKADRRSDAQKVLAFANGTREGPMLHMDCILDGLSAARRQFGLEHH